ncbi:tripartite tricarboxylate transporter TctB family protein [Stutzerimonas tarimensis]|uniref:Tripartite tricarboxylate transporter TctB family protein n=1 Tax=Stutzerimonas tarimensis TaxID=1507735 RepID=A0ABV7TAR1_9GAMM
MGSTTNRSADFFQRGVPSRQSHQQAEVIAVPLSRPSSDDDQPEGSPARSIHWPELCTCVGLILLGLAVAATSWSYGIGTVTRMGTGFFPLMLGLMLAGVGSLVACEVWRTTQRDRTPFPFRPAVCVIAGILCFALSVESLGLVPAVFMLAALSIIGRPGFNPMLIVWIGTAMSAFSWLVFIVGFNLPLEAVRGW